MKTEYPGVYLATLQDMGRFEEAQNYMIQCQGYRSSIDLYTTYVKGYLEPYLEELRNDNKLRESEKTITCDGKKW